MRKKNRLSFKGLRNNLLKGMLKPCLLLLIVSLWSNVSAVNIFSQSSSMNLRLSNVKVEKLFSEIEKNSDYVILYKKGIIENKVVSIDSENETPEEILDKALPPIGLDYHINGKQIIVVENRKAESITNTAEVQQNVVQAKGSVHDSKNEPLIGVSIVEKGKVTNGTITDIDGNFSLNVSPGATIVLTYMGYKVQEIKVPSNGAVGHIVMQEDIQMLEDVVVVGYGVQKKVNLTGSVATISTKDIENRPIQNITSGLQGLMSGVSITGLNGAPGRENGEIRVRGTGTLNNSKPYILIDGIESETINAVDPNDIESVSVLKDAASAAIYGSKAANGVILITTKRGSTEKTKVSYSGYLSFQNATKTIDRMGSYEYASLYNQVLEDSGRAKRFTDEELSKFKSGNDPLYPDTDWYDLAYKTGIQHRHNVNVAGGTDNIKYMASLGYLNQTGILKNASREQFNARTNLDMKLSNRFNARLNLSYIKNDYKDPSSAYAGGSSDQIIRQLNVIAPWIVGRHDDGTWGTISDGSPIAWLDSGMTVDRYNQNFSGIAALDFKIIDGLVFTLQGAYVNNWQNFSYFRKYIKYNENKESEPNRLEERYYTWNRTNYDALLNYDKSFGKHNIKGLLGWHTEKYNKKDLLTSREKFPNNYLTDMNAGDPSTQKNEGYTKELSMISWFGRVNYDYDGKYLFEANIRADASSRFAEGHRWGYFPSFSAGWRISEEAFMTDLRDSWLSNLKLRASWGKLGNQDALGDYYPSINTYKVDASYPFGGSLNSGYYQKIYRMETISWEKTETWGIGLDFTLFNQLNASIDYYNRKTTDIIMDVTVPNEFALDPYVDNAGSLRNRGIEVSLNYNTKIDKVRLGFTGNFAYNKNEVIYLQGADYQEVKNTSGLQHYAIGNPASAYYLYKADGFFNSQEEADAYTTKYGNPFGKKFMAGDLKYVDTNGDGSLSAADRIYTKNTPEPKIVYGFNINADWNNFDLILTFNGAAKATRLFDAYEVYGNFSGDASHPATIWRDAWRPDNLNAKMPRLHYDANSPSNYRSVKSDFWLEDISYLRLKNLQIGYTIPKKLLSSVGISGLRIYYSTENLLTFDKMRANVDPEATSSRISSYPLLQTHAFGVNITF
ncbi:TonB-dependent receptor [Dysgonomonas sp. OttesenSCG-928-M03]|nr:TonB-dependent receptor [Dysgonomonas sp. OttesenSCG-928-M03]